MQSSRLARLPIRAVRSRHHHHHNHLQKSKKLLSQGCSSSILSLANKPLSLPPLLLCHHPSSPNNRHASSFPFRSFTSDSGKDDDFDNKADEDAPYETYDDYEDDYEDDDGDGGFNSNNNNKARRSSSPNKKKNYSEAPNNNAPNNAPNNNNNNDNGDDYNKRIWLDPNTPLEDRVGRFLNRQLGHLHPLDVTLSSVDLIRECGKLQSFEGMTLAHDILDRLLEEKRHVNTAASTEPEHRILLSDRPFKVLMYGWSNLSRSVEFAPQRMREVLDVMIQEAENDEQLRKESADDGNDSVMILLSDEQHKKISDREHVYAGLSCQPTVDIYNTLLQGLVQASFRSIAAASEAEGVLRIMDGIHRKRGWHTKPNTKSFTLAITAFCKTRHYTAGDRAEAILRRMIDYHQQERELYLEETGTEYDMHNPSANKRRIVTPDTIAYSAVIQAHAISGADKAGEKALALLTELMQSDHPALKPDAFVFANTINAFAKTAASRKKSPKERLEAAERAEIIAWLMVEECQKKTSATTTNNNTEEIDDDDDSNSNSSSLSSSFQASIVPFNACLNAWASSGLPEAGARAEALLQKLFDPELQNLGVQPNNTSFNTCMQAWAKAARTDPEAPQKAEELLTLMLEVSSSSADDDHRTIMQPDTQSYTTVMNAYAQSTRKDKALQARRILESMLSNTTSQRGRRPISAVPFTVLLNAVAHSPGIGTTDESKLMEEESYDAFGSQEDDDDDVANSRNGDPYSIALETYNELISDDIRVQPDHLVFATMLDVIRQHTNAESIERRQRVESIVADARVAGEVSSLVVQALQKACPTTDMLQTLLQIPPRKSSQMESINVLPRAWTRNVPPKFRRVQSTSSSSSSETTNNNGKGGRRNEQRRQHNNKPRRDKKEERPPRRDKKEETRS